MKSLLYILVLLLGLVSFYKFITYNRNYTLTKEFGNSITGVSDSPNEVFKFKGWCLSDHVIGLEIEYKNIDNPTLNCLKSDVNNPISLYCVYCVEF